MSKKASVYKKNFDRLKAIENEIRSQEEPDVDAIVPLVKEAMIVFSVCKKRLEAAKSALGEALPDELSKVGS